jgi:hypothetical protein
VGSWRMQGKGVGVMNVVEILCTHAIKEKFVSLNPRTIREKLISIV